MDFTVCSPLLGFLISNFVRGVKWWSDSLIKGFLFLFLSCQTLCFRAERNPESFLERKTNPIQCIRSLWTIFARGYGVGIPHIENLACVTSCLVGRLVDKEMPTITMRYFQKYKRLFRLFFLHFLNCHVRSIHRQVKNKRKEMNSK